MANSNEAGDNTLPIYVESSWRCDNLKSCFTIGPPNIEPTMEDIIQVENCVNLIREDDMKETPCTIDVKTEDKTLAFTTIQIVSQCRLIEVFGLHGEYLTTCRGDLFDEFEDVTVYETKIQLKSALTTFSLKFTRLKEDVFWIYGIYLKISSLQNKNGQFNPNQKFNNENILPNLSQMSNPNLTQMVSNPNLTQMLSNQNLTQMVSNPNLLKMLQPHLGSNKPEELENVQNNQTNNSSGINTSQIMNKTNKETNKDLIDKNIGINKEDLDSLLEKHFNKLNNSINSKFDIMQEQINELNIKLDEVLSLSNKQNDTSLSNKHSDINQSKKESDIIQSKTESDRSHCKTESDIIQSKTESDIIQSKTESDISQSKTESDISQSKTESDKSK